jgi:hypothetical protein
MDSALEKSNFCQKLDFCVLPKSYSYYFPAIVVPNK